jgi:outer membrane protein
MRFIILSFCFMIASAGAAKELRIGTVDLQKLFKEYPGTKKAQKKFTAMAEKKKKDLEDSAEELRDLQTELKRSGSVLSDKLRKQKETELRQKDQNLAQLENQYRTDLAMKEAEMTQSILAELKSIVAETAKENGIDLVLDSEKTVYVKEGEDLTPAVLKKYKKTDADTGDEVGSKKK